MIRLKIDWNRKTLFMQSLLEHKLEQGFKGDNDDDGI